MPTKTKDELEQEKLLEEGAQLYKKLEPVFDKENGHLSLVEKVKALQVIIEPLKGFSPKEVMGAIDRLTASHEMLAKAIRRDRRTGYVSGMEEEEFNGLKFILGCRFGHEKMGSEKEFELVKGAYAAVEKKYGAKAAHAIGDPERGATFIPDQFIAEPVAALYHDLVFVKWGDRGTQRLRVLDGLVGLQVRMPKAEGGIVIYTAGEESTATESVAKSKDIVANPKKLHALIKITESMRDFAPAQFNQYVQSEMFNKMGEKLDYLIGYGTGGDNEPLGLMKSAGIGLFSAQLKATVANTTAAIASANSGDWLGGEFTFDIAELLKTALKRSKVKPNGSFAMVSAPELWTRMRLSKYITHASQTTEKPFLLGMFLSDPKLRELIGNYDETAQFSDSQKPGVTIGAPSASGTAKYTDVLAANYDQGFLFRWFGLKLEDDAGKGTGFASGAMFQRMSMSFDVGIGREQAFMLCPDAKAKD